MLVPISTFSITQSFETSSVARIVGSTPEEMMVQLAEEKMILEHATLYSNDKILPRHFGANRPRDINQTLSLQFPGKNNLNFSTQHMIFGQGWEWDDVADAVNKVKKRDFIIVESRGDLDGNKLTAISPEWYDDDLTPESVNWDLSRKPLMLFDSDYAGIHLPTMESFVSKLAKYAKVIAPAFTHDNTLISSPDREFTKAFICSLRNELDLGTIYRNARNSYYWSSQSPSGLSLASYSLYGDPTVNVTIPDGNFFKWEESCGAFLKNYVEQIQKAPQKGMRPFSASGNDDEGLFLNVGFRLDNYTLQEEGNLTLLILNNSKLLYEFGELVLPYASKSFEFPLRTIIANFSFRLSDPINISIPSLPSWQGGLVNRSCFAEESNATSAFSLMFGDDREIATATIRPIQVLNCTEGRFTLWRQVNYSFNYKTFSPIIIQAVSHPGRAFPGSTYSLTASLKKVVLDSKINGSLVVQKGNVTVAEKNISFTAPEQNISLGFITEPIEDITGYTLSFTQGNETMASTVFSIENVLLESFLKVPEGVNSTTKVGIELFNHGNTTLPITVMDYLVQDGILVSSSTTDKSLPLGYTEVNLSYSGLTKENRSYSLIVDVIYSGKKKTLSGALVTNHPPALAFLRDIIVSELQDVSVSPNATDFEGDSITYSISSPIGNDAFWETGLDDAGNYTVVITASDGLLEDNQTILVAVKNFVPPAIFYGSVLEPNGDPVEDNTAIDTYANNTFIAGTLAKDGKYNISIPADDPETSYLDGAIENANISIFIGGSPAKTNLTWQNGTITNQTLQISDPCFAVVCNQFCNGSALNYNGTCNGGSCVYAEYTNYSGCSANFNTFTVGLVDPQAVVIKDNLFKFTGNITCTSGNCGEINITLDPILNAFSNGKNTERLAFTGDQNITRYIHIPRDAYLNNASLVFRGQSFEGLFKEYDDIGFQGKLSNLTLVDSLVVEDKSSQKINFKTGGFDNGLGCSRYCIVIIQDVLNISINGNLFCGVWGVNVQECTSEMELNKPYVNNGKNNISVSQDFDCCKWKPLDSVNLSGPSQKLVDSTWAYNPYVLIGNQSVYRFTDGIFSASASITNVSNEISVFLSSCSAESDGMCSVPLLFHSDKAGILDVKDIEIVYGVGNVTLQSASIAPVNPSLGDSLVGNCLGEDGQDKKLSYFWVWYKDGLIFKDGRDSINETTGLMDVHPSGKSVHVDSISTESLNRGDSWILSCLASNGVKNSTWVNSTAVAVSGGSTPKGIIPEDSGTPFFVISDFEPNPTSCNLDEGESCIVEWRVNATGGLNETYEFFIIGGAGNVQNESNRINVTILNATSCEPIWENINSSCGLTDKFNITYQYTNACCEETGLEEDCTIPLNTTGDCDYCNPNFTEVTNPCGNDNVIGTWFNDTLGCYAKTNLSQDYFPSGTIDRSKFLNIGGGLYAFDDINHSLLNGTDPYNDPVSVNGSDVTKYGWRIMADDAGYATYNLIPGLSGGWHMNLSYRSIFIGLNGTDIGFCVNYFGSSSWSEQFYGADIRAGDEMRFVFSTNDCKGEICIYNGSWNPVGAKTTGKNTSCFIHNTTLNKTQLFLGGTLIWNFSSPISYLSLGSFNGMAPEGVEFSNIMAWNVSLYGKHPPRVYANTTEPCEYETNVSIALEKGWNLISFPLRLKNSTFPLATDNGSSLSVISFRSSKWAIVENGSINETIGYWVKSPHNASLTLRGTRLNITGWELGAGWHLMGFPYTWSLNVSDAMEKLTGWSADYTILSYWNNAYLTYGPGRNETLNSLDVMKPAQGYWVWRAKE